MILLATLKHQMYLPTVLASLKLPLTFYPLTKIWQGSTVVKAFQTVERGVFTDSDILSPQDKKNLNKRREDWRIREEEDRHTH